MKIFYLYKGLLAQAFFYFTSCGMALSAQNTLTRLDLLSHPVKEQKAIFQSLNPENCYQIWLQKMQNNLSFGKLDSNQSVLVLELTSRLNANLYDGDTTNDFAFDHFYNDWILKARVTFTVDEFIRSFVKLNDYNDSNVLIVNGGNIDCGCSSASDWCSFLDEDEHCVATECRQIRGCGTLWRHRCNGRCTMFGVRLGSRNPSGMY